jgi:hypothetical protein
VATVVCLQLAAIVPNFLIQEHFDPFNEPWTKELVTWTPELDVKNRPSSDFHLAWSRIGSEYGCAARAPL